MTNDFDQVDLPREEDMYWGGVTNETAFEKAKEAGLEVFVPGPNDITVDIDSPELPEPFNEVLKILKQHFDIEVKKTTKSKSGNLHVYLYSPQFFTHSEKIALQAILGSDPKREALSLVRSVKGGLGHPSLLFEKKAA